MLTPKQIEILTEDRINFYREGLPESVLVGFFLCRNNAYLTNVLGKEFEYKVKQHLEKTNAKNIQSEVDIENTSIDLMCDIENKRTTIEAKCCKTLTRKCITQIKKYKGKYKDSKVFVAVPKNTTIPEPIQKEINKYGDILRIDTTKQEIVKELLNMQRLIKALK